MLIQLGEVKSLLQLGNKDSAGRKKIKGVHNEQITIPGYGSNTRSGFARSVGMSYEGWKSRYIQWLDGRITVEQLMEPKVTPQEAGKRSNESQK